MKKNLYAIYDRKSNTYENYQWQDINDDCAYRTVNEIVNAIAPNKLNQAPEDYTLYRLGEIDLETGIITPKVDFLKNVIEFKKPVDKEKLELLEKIDELKKAIMGVK